MQQDSKQHTLGFGVLVSISLSLSVSLGVSLWSYDTLLLLLLLLFYTCGDTSLLVCILYLQLHICLWMIMHVCFYVCITALCLDSTPCSFLVLLDDYRIKVVSYKITALCSASPWRLLFILQHRHTQALSHQHESRSVTQEYTQRNAVLDEILHRKKIWIIIIIIRLLDYKSGKVWHEMYELFQIAYLFFFNCPNFLSMFCLFWHGKIAINVFFFFLCV